jgi:hypothetical protein
MLFLKIEELIVQNLNAENPDVFAELVALDDNPRRAFVAPRGAQPANDSAKAKTTIALPSIASPQSRND